MVHASTNANLASFGSTGLQGDRENAKFARGAILGSIVDKSGI
jgi:hypothetical protein